jgi:hypothetical protein
MKIQTAAFLKVKELLALLDGVGGPRGAVATDTGMVKDLEVVAALEGLVAEEVDLVEVPRGQELEAVGLVPALGEHIEGDLASDGVLEIEVRELLRQCVHHLLANTMLLNIIDSEHIVGW